MIQDYEKLKKFNTEVSKMVAKGYTIVDKNDETRMCVMEKRSKINHGLHIVLSVITAGFWLIIYALVLLTSSSKPKTITILVQ